MIMGNCRDKYGAKKRKHCPKEGCSNENPTCSNKQREEQNTETTSGSCSSDCRKPWQRTVHRHAAEEETEDSHCNCSNQQGILLFSMPIILGNYRNHSFDPLGLLEGCKSKRKSIESTSNFIIDFRLLNHLKKGRLYTFIQI